MALSSPGIGSGIDVQGIVQKLVSIERQPLAKVDARVGELKTQISAYGTLKSAVSTFRDAVGALAEPAKFKVNAAQSSDTKVLTASAGSEAARGTYQLEVKRLAEAHRLATEQAQASATEAAVGLGSTLTLSAPPSRSTSRARASTRSATQSTAPPATRGSRRRCSAPTTATA